MTLQELIRPNILKLTPYTCARNEFTGEALAWLDANENSRITKYNRYPDPLQMAVKERLGAYRGVAPENIFLGVGSDECIDIAYRVFCRPGIDNVVAIEPTYGMYQVCADINDVEYRRVSLNDDFSLDIDALIAACDSNTKIMWICSPNNPTANAFPLEQIKEVTARFEGITIVDEAYIDFSTVGSMVQFLDKYPRMIVMQTFSKAWASAAIRLGISYASTEIIDIYNKVKYPYNISELTQNEALKALDDSARVEAVAREIVEARNALTEELAVLPDVLKIYPSDANFLLVKVSNADAIYEYLRDEKVIVRNRTRVHKCGDCLRLTVGNDIENQLLIDAIKRYSKPEDERLRNRIAMVGRSTSETSIEVAVNLDGQGRCDISTGLGFFDHLLEQIGRHGGLDLTVKTAGDLNVDEHHTIEDTAIALGEALREALGDKRGIERYGYVLPMDDCLCTVAIDFGGRPWLVWEAEFKREKIGDVPTEMFLHFFKSLSDSARMNLFIRAEGDNEHHKIEGIFKGLARAIKMAVRRDIFRYTLPSTKGTL